MRFFRSTPRVLPAQATEADHLADLYRRAWQDCERMLDARLVAHESVHMEDVSSWFLGGFEVFKVRHEGQMIGAVRCCFPTSACLVDHLLLEHVIARARRAGVTRVWAQVSPKLEPAHALFRSFGFRDTSRVRAT